jgi:hypothetical protein
MVLIMNLMRCDILLAICVCVPVGAHALINFGAGNLQNLSDPGTGVPFDAVARVSHASGSSLSGTALHLGGGYMLTADHVSMRDVVSFDGVTDYTVDTSFTPQQVATGVDMKVFKLDMVPGVSSVRLLDSPLEEVAEATLIGWGLGRDPSEPLFDTVVDWGASSTSDKRWGLNVPEPPPFLYEAGGYSYVAFGTALGDQSSTNQGLGDNEAAATLYDSGSGLFQELGGLWYLIGLTTAVESSGSSTYGDDVLASDGDVNIFVRISAYESDIMALIPEPRASIALAIASLLLVGRRR